MLPDWDKGVGWRRSSCFSWVQNFEPYSVSNISDSLQHQWEYIGESYVNFVSAPSDNASYLLKHKYIMSLQVCAPTGAGKTNIAMISVLHEVSTFLLGLIFLFPNLILSQTCWKHFEILFTKSVNRFFFLNVCMLCCKRSWYIVIMLKCFIFYSYII